MGLIKYFKEMRKRNEIIKRLKPMKISEHPNNQNNFTQFEKLITKAKEFNKNKSPFGFLYIKLKKYQGLLNLYNTPEGDFYYSKISEIFK